jgi:hypothetical protein
LPRFYSSSGCSAARLGIAAQRQTAIVVAIFRRALAYEMRLKKVAHDAPVYPEIPDMMSQWKAAREMGFATTSPAFLQHENWNGRPMLKVDSPISRRRRGPQDWQLGRACSVLAGVVVTVTLWCAFWL